MTLSQLLLLGFEHIIATMKSKLIVVFLLNLSIAIAETVGGIFSRSYALLSDALHNFQDSISQLFSLLAIYLSEKGRTRRYTFGFKRYEILAALLNASVIFFLSFLMIYRGIERIISPVVVKFSVLLPVSVLGLVANFVSILLLHTHAKSSLNIKSTYLHLLSDTFSSVAVVIGAIIMKIFNFYMLDGILAVLIGIFILKEAFEVVRESLRIFLQVSPFPVDETQILDLLKHIKGFKGIHHIHVWSLKDGETHLEAHLEMEDMMLSETAGIMREISETLKKHLNINHITLQLETGYCNQKEC